MSLEKIRQMAEEQGYTARAEEKQPYIAKHNKDAGIKACPNFGTYVPEGWILKEQYFVDSSGFSTDAELAGHSCLSFNQLVKKVKKGRGYAIIEVGQFQLHVGEFVSDWTLAGTPYTKGEYDEDTQ